MLRQYCFLSGCHFQKMKISIEFYLFFTNRNAPPARSRSEKMIEKTDAPIPGTPPCLMAVSRSIASFSRLSVISGTDLSVCPSCMPSAVTVSLVLKSEAL
jgi:hypothetical protein